MLESFVGHINCFTYLLDLGKYSAFTYWSLDAIASAFLLSGQTSERQDLLLDLMAQ